MVVSWFVLSLNGVAAVSFTHWGKWRLNDLISDHNSNQNHQTAQQNEGTTDDGAR
jgi:hypothetical protein